VPVCPTRQVTGPDDAVAAASGFDGPVVVKSAAPGLTHRSELGAVAVGLADETRVAQAARRISTATGSTELLVQPVVDTGVELLVGLSMPAGGIPVAMLALGGIHEAMHADRVLRTLPLDSGAITSMIAELRSAPLLFGHRGSPALDVPALADAITRIALLDAIAPQLRELDVNPLTIHEDGVTAVDVKVRLATPDEPLRQRDPVAEDYSRALG
jgi:hypothetical protein